MSTKKAKLSSVEKVEDESSKKYDITTEKTHNFFADGFLVHNCCTMYHFGGRWRVHTLGTVEAEGPIQLDARASAEHPEWEGKTYADLFWEAFGRRYGDLDTTPLDKDKIYVFELCTPVNQVVVRHDRWKLPLLVVRNRHNLQELPVEHARFSFFERPERFEISEFGDAAELCDRIDDEGGEGVMIRDKFFRRIKIKGDDYRFRHKVKSGLLQRDHGAIELVQKGVEDDFIGYFPGLEDVVDDVKAGMEELEGVLEDEYKTCGGPDTDPDDHEDRKEFARKVERWVDGPLQGLMFSKLNGDIDSFMEGIRDLKPEVVAKHVDSG